jgi:deferrochelatase/peroxidase EfeB
MTSRHRVVRRGQPYGPPLPEGAPDDGAERGLLFLCLGSSIERQFEFVVRLWFNDGARVRSGDDRDPLLGAPGGSGRFVLPGPVPVVLEGVRSFVTTRGGDYFLLPGLRALRALADGSGSR